MGESLILYHHEHWQFFFFFALGCSKCVYLKHPQLTNMVANRVAKIFLFSYYWSKYEIYIIQLHQIHIYLNHTRIWNLCVSLLYLVSESSITRLPRGGTKHSHLAAVETSNCLSWCVLNVFFSNVLHDDFTGWADEFHTSSVSWHQFRLHCSCAGIQLYQPLSLYLWEVEFSEVQGFNVTAGTRLFHCDEQVWRTNLTGNRTEIQHRPLEGRVCVSMFTNLFVDYSLSLITSERRPCL